MTSRGARFQAAVVFCLAVLAGVAAYVWRPTLHLSDQLQKIELDRLFPKEFAGWVVDTRGPVQLVSPDQQAVLNMIYNQTLSQTYVNTNGDRVMLSVAYGGDQSDGTRAHRPEICYPAQGFQVRGDSVTTLPVEGNPGLRARKLIAQQGARVEPITYWLVVGDRVALSGTEQKFAQLRFSLKGVIPDGMLVRVSTIDSQVDHAYGVQSRFVKDLAKHMNGPSKARVFGAAS